MESLQKDIEEFICNRQQAAYQEIKDDPDFIQLLQDILSLQEQILEAIPSGVREHFLKYCELVNKRSSIIEEHVYRKGFSDGTTIHTHNYI